MAIVVPPGFYDTGLHKAFIITKQVAVAQSPVLLLPGSGHRVGAVITNLSANTVYISGDSNVNVNDGHALLTQNSIALVSSGEVWAISSVGTNTVTFLEETLR